MNIPLPPGVFDILPYDSKEKWRSSYLWQYVEEVIRQTARDYGYLEIRTPLFERTELFKRGVGETSDIVSKEMYTFLDKGERSMSLRPEGTAPVIRAFVEHQMHQEAPVHKLYYIASMFRYERAQAGRYRQHHQFGAETIGSDSPEQDVEVIDLLYTLYQRLGLKDLQLCINSLGDPECRKKFRQALLDYLKPHFQQLSQDSQTRFSTNPLRILDSKDPQDRKIVANAPSLSDFLSKECQDHFQSVLSLLKQLNIPYVVSPHLVRGLDYYNRTVFEVTAGELGAQNSLGGGGRYDGLLQLLGGPDLPTFGFGTGIERIIHTILKQGAPEKAPERPVLFLIALGSEARKVCFGLLHDLRANGIPAYMDFSGKKVGKLLQYADQIGSKFVAVVGENELRSQEVELKDMATGELTKAPLNHLPRILQVEATSERFLQMWGEMAKPFAEKSEAEFFMKRLGNSLAQTKKLATELASVTEKMQNILGDE